MVWASSLDHEMFESTFANSTYYSYFLLAHDPGRFTLCVTSLRFTELLRFTWIG